MTIMNKIATTVMIKNSNNDNNDNNNDQQSQ